MKITLIIILAALSCGILSAAIKHTGRCPYCGRRERDCDGDCEQYETKWE